MCASDDDALHFGAEQRISEPLSALAVPTGRHREKRARPGFSQRVNDMESGPKLVSKVKICKDKVNLPKGFISPQRNEATKNANATDVTTAPEDVNDEAEVAMLLQDENEDAGSIVPEANDEADVVMF